MLRAGFSHREATMYISLFNILIIAMVFLLDSLGIFLLALVLLTVCLLATWVLAAFVHRKEKESTFIKTVADLKAEG
jgi:4-hydroxybenzoate polyprenyltransferase